MTQLMLFGTAVAVVTDDSPAAMLTPPQILHHIAGSMAAPGCVPLFAPVACYVCGGETTRGVSADRALPSSFTAHAECRAPWSTVVCEPCVWVMAGKPSATNPPARMFSHLWSEEGGGWWKENKGGDQAPVWDALLTPPSGRWFLAMAESGQIHLLPFTPVNTHPGAWAVRYEREVIYSTPLRFAALAWHVLRLYAAGFTRAHIESGQPDVEAIRRAGADIWRHHDPHINPTRGSALLRLVLALLRKERTDDWLDRCTRALDGAGRLPAGPRMGGQEPDRDERGGTAAVAGDPDDRAHPR